MSKYVTTTNDVTIIDNKDQEKEKNLGLYSYVTYENEFGDKNFIQFKPTFTR